MVLQSSFVLEKVSVPKLVFLFSLILFGFLSFGDCTKEKSREILKNRIRANSKNKKEAKLELFILTDINNYNSNNYINVSIFNNNAELAPEAKLELHLPQKQSPDRHPGSIPGWGGSAFSQNLIRGEK